MRIIIEEHDIEWKLPTDRKIYLKDIIEEVETFLLTVGKVPMALTIDGHALVQEELEQRQDDELAGKEVLEFGVIELSDFILDNLEGASHANAKLLENINTFADELYSTNKTIEPKAVIEGLKDFFFFWYRLNNLFPKVFGGVKLSGSSLEERIAQLQDIFKDIVAAMEDQDTVLAADLLQYEVGPIVEAIGKGVPAMKERVQEFKNQENDGSILPQNNKEKVK